MNRQQCSIFMEAEGPSAIAGIVIIIIPMFVNLIILNGKKDACPPYRLGNWSGFEQELSPRLPASLNIPTTEDMRTALGASFTGEGFFLERIGAFTTLSSEMTEATKKFNQMVATKSKRKLRWGEWHLDEELRESFLMSKLGLKSRS